MLRSIDSGTNRVHQRLNPGRAITLCWIANADSSSRSTSTACQAAPVARPLSTVWGTTTSARNAIA
ncbi:MAG: hypothetical protein L0K86_16990 [Actinomycetia bacterium]|nr:hypothetical protein [Actinomycetes bacterium]